MGKELEGKVALITGGSRGIGRATALELADRGASISFCYMGNEEKAHETVELCKEKGVAVLCTRADVSLMSDVERLVKATVESFGTIDILVNNAGITRDCLMAMMSEEEFMKVIDTNLKGTFLCTKLVSRIMIRHRSGRIINLSSVVGIQGNAGQVNYASSKAGVIGLTKAAAKELAIRGITVNAVAPGYVATDMTEAMTDEAKIAVSTRIPLSRLGKAEDIAKAVAFLASEGSSYITGQVLSVDGGLNM